MEIKYTNDKSTQILIALLKAHKIRKVVASPGTTNAIFVASIQNDPDFQVYSSVDERSAAYIACGIAGESGEPVVITCTEATASRNYFPGLTEAYYRKLPILAVTGLHSTYNIGNLCTQAIDRSQAPKDTIRYSTTIEHCKSKEDEWHVNLEINKAILELTRNGGGPVHINMQIGERWDFYVDKLPEVRVIRRINVKDQMPAIPNGKIAIVIGSHKKYTLEETKLIDDFCACNNAVVFSDVISGYHGKYRVNCSLLKAQKTYTSPIFNVDLVISLGEVGWSSANAKVTWRINEDGEIRDPSHNLTYLFDMDESTFFKHYISDTCCNTFFDECTAEIESIISKIPELPFSNAWLANNTVNRIPKNIVMHFGILNSFRVWNYYMYDDSIDTSCNFGGFGIDGGISTLIGASLVEPQKMHVGVFGDLAFFYDMNSLGNRHIGDNLRILLINNGKGNEFRNCIHPAYKLGAEADPYIAAAGHYGQKSSNLVRHYAEDLGYKYMTASSKAEYLNQIDEFFDPDTRYSIIFEVFIDGKDESDALNVLSNLKSSSSSSIKEKVKEIVREAVGDKTVLKLKNIIK